MKETLIDKIDRWFHPKKHEAQQKPHTQILGNVLHIFDASQRGTKRMPTHQNPIIHGTIPLTSRVVRIRGDIPTQPVIRSNETHPSQPVRGNLSWLDIKTWRRNWKSKADHYNRVVSKREKRTQK